MGESRRMRPLLGTFVEIGANGGGTDVDLAINEAFARIEAIQAMLSFQDPESEISRLNQRPGQWLPMSHPSLRVLRLARAIGIASKERFNCTVGGKMVSWGLLPGRESAARIEVGNAHDIDIRRGAARLRRPVLVTLDGIAKGFAVDRAIAVLMRHGVPSAWVNAGGDLRVYGDKSLDISRREIDGSFTKLGVLNNGAVASSFAGDYADKDLPSRLVGALPGNSEAAVVVSVMASNAWRADALTKVAGATPPPERSRIVSRMGGRLIEAGTL